jgi:hypothetical protein
MMTRLLALALGAGAATQVAAATPAQQIRIDAGAVNVELVDAPADAAPELTYRAQGSCQPEVTIVQNGEALEARHIKSCHGTGRGEGTIFTLRISSRSNFLLTLDAGGVRIRGDLDHYRRLDFAVRVGGIKNFRRDVSLSQERHLLVGATALFERDGGESDMVVKLKYGGISLY